MAFDFGTWVFGYSLKKLADVGLNHLNKETFIKELSNVVESWAGEMPEDKYVNASAIFPDSKTSFQNDNKSIEILRDYLKNKKLPSVKIWFNALNEQWKLIKSKYGSEAQPFFLLNEVEANKFLLGLANDLHNVCKENSDIFQHKVIDDLEIIHKKINKLSLVHDKKLQQSDNQYYMLITW